MLFVNRGVNQQTMTVLWEDIGLPLDMLVEVRDIWEHETLKTNFVGNLTVSVASHASKMFILTPIG